MQLEARNISFRYQKGAPYILRSCSISIEQGHCTAITAPSGYGKSTLVHLLAGYETPEKGEVLLGGSPLPKRGFCPVQLIPQHPEKAINPHWTMAKVLAESGEPDGETMEALGIRQEWLRRYPHQLSGGELQRFCIARALAGDTKFLLADEMSAMLDVITQAQIWHYLMEAGRKRNIGIIMLTHNMALAKRVSERIIHLPEINQS